MRSGVLDISHVDGSGSPVSTKISVFFHGYGGSVVIDAPEIEVPEIEVQEIEALEMAPDGDFPSPMR